MTTIVTNLVSRKFSKCQNSDKKSLSFSQKINYTQNKKWENSANPVEYFVFLFFNIFHIIFYSNLNFIIIELWLEKSVISNK